MASAPEVTWVTPPLPPNNEHEVRLDDARAFDRMRRLQAHFPEAQTREYTVSAPHTPQQPVTVSKGVDLLAVMTGILRYLYPHCAYFLQVKIALTFR